jgi:hypothetical protein
MPLPEVKNPKAPLARKKIARRFISGLKKLESTLAITPALSPTRLHCATARFRFKVASKRSEDGRRGGIVRRLPVRASGFGFLSGFDIRISDFLP